MVGGAFLCYEGFEKLAHRFLHSKDTDEARHSALTQALADPAVDLVARERKRIKGAVRTDFILSAEIIAITLGTVAAAPFTQQVIVLAGIAAIMTAGVYGLVAGIVKLDDAGLYLSLQSGDGAFDRLQRRLGAAILAAAPFLMKGLSIAGTAAMFLVGGGIITHAVHPLHAVVEHATEAVAGIPAAGGVFATIVPLLIDAAVGMIVGAVVLLVVTGVKKLLPKKKGEGATS
jgi:predicted DNA repair protein MutK